MFAQRRSIVEIVLTMVRDTCILLIRHTPRSSHLLVTPCVLSSRQTNSVSHLVSWYRGYVGIHSYEIPFFILYVNVLLFKRLIRLRGLDHVSPHMFLANFNQYIVERHRETSFATPYLSTSLFFVKGPVLGKTRIAELNFLLRVQTGTVLRFQLVAQCDIRDMSIFRHTCYLRQWGVTASTPKNSRSD